MTSCQYPPPSYLDDNYVEIPQNDLLSEIQNKWASEEAHIKKKYQTLQMKESQKLEKALAELQKISAQKMQKLTKQMETELAHMRQTRRVTVTSWLNQTPGKCQFM